MTFSSPWNKLLVIFDMADLPKTPPEPVKLKPRIPVGPLRDTVIFPGNSVPIISGRPKSKYLQ